MAAEASNHVYIEDLARHAGEEVTLKGWLNNKRSSGKIHFLQLRDGTGVCQCVASLADVGAESFAAADHMGQETSLEVSGIVRADKRAPGGYELTIKSIKMVAPAIDYPITPKDHGVSARQSASVGALVAPARDFASPQRSRVGLPRFFS